MRRTRLLLLVGSGLFFLGSVVLWLLWAQCGLEGCPDVAQLSGYVPDEASVVLDREGRELGHLYRVNRVVVPIDSMPPYLPAAFIAVEDQRFWKHGGVDWYRVVGAAWANLRARRVEEGFSTITMQLARNVFPKRIPLAERTLRRKWTEMRVAAKIEREFTKEQILELYLNQIYFGEGAWGVEAAAAEYFDKSASELTLGEAAILAGLIRAPQRLNPRRNLEGARGRRGVVLAKMVEQGLISPADASAAAGERIMVRRGEVRHDGKASYFLEEVRQEMEAELGSALYTGGYLIYTTLDPVAQAAAEEELEAQLVAVESGRHGAFRHPRRSASEGASAGASGDDDNDGGGSSGAAEETRYLQGAVVVMNAQTGDVLALVGGRDFSDSKFDRAVQALRQPGSAFKPFVYGAALAAGFPPTQILSDEPLRRVLPDGTVWEPSNYEGSYRGDITMRAALAQSRNVATIRLAEEVGLERVIDFARRLGISTPIPAVPSIAIGAAEVTLLELTTAYAAIATLGRRPEPRLVTRVEDRGGNVVWERSPRVMRALDPAIAFLLTDLMRGVVDRGTGTPVRAAGFSAPAAGKTGTTNGSTDVWFLGFTPEIVTGVWIGLDRPQAIVPGATGGRLAAPVWGRIMRRIAPAGGGEWTQPPGVEMHWVDEAGRVYQDGCPFYGELRSEYFLAGTTPPDGCAGLGFPLLGRPLTPGGGLDSGLVRPDSIDGWDQDTTPGADGWWDRMRRRMRGQDAEPDRESDAGSPRPDSGVVRTPRRGEDPDSGEVRRRRGDEAPPASTRPGDDPAGDPADDSTRDRGGRTSPADSPRRPPAKEPRVLGKPVPRG